MPLWWGKSSSKDLKRKPNGGSFINAMHRKFKSGSQGKNSSKSGGSERFTDDIVSQKGLATSRSALTSLQVSRCQSFAEESLAQPLPSPGLCLANVENADSDHCTSILELQGCFKPLPVSLPIHGYVLEKPLASDAWGDLATASVSSNSSVDTDDKPDSRLLSPLASDYESGNITAISSPSRNKDQSPTGTRRILKEQEKPPHLPSNDNIPYTSAKRQGPLTVHMSKLQIPPHAGFFSSPDSLISSPSRSPVRAYGNEKVMSSGFCSGIPCWEANLVASGHRFSPGSGQTSGRNSVGGDITLFWPQSRCSPECSPIPSPKMASPGPVSRIHSGGVTPLHALAGGLAAELSLDKPGDGKLQAHRLPLPPVAVSTSSPFSSSHSTITTPSHLRNPGHTDSSMIPASRWKKGCLIGSGTFGRVYKGFNSESGETCAIKEVTLFSDDAKSKENSQQLGQEITLLSRLRHPNIVRYFGSETVDDKLCIYLEYVSGGSIHKILQEYGQLGESAIRSYTQQILCGLVYLHAKNIVHRDIKGANILVDPNGKVKLADFGMAKHITGLSCPLSFKGSPYWMAPEVIRNSDGYNLAVDIWSLGCTVIEMATAKPPWSQYEGVAALFKIGNSKELPTIPDHLSEEGKDFVRQCLQRNPLDRPTAARLLEHPFVQSLKSSKFPYSLRRFTNVASHKDMGCGKKFSRFDSGVNVQLCRGYKSGSGSSKSCMPKHVSCPVSPIGSPLLCAKSSQPTRRMTFPTISTCHTASSSTPHTGRNGAFPIHHFNHSGAYSNVGVGFQQPQKGPLDTRAASETLRGIPETV